MTPPVNLGPRASLLLGLLVGTPRTIDELLALVDAGIDDYGDVLEDLPQVFGSPGLALRSISDAGPDEVRRLLLRLEEHGLVGRLELDGSELWRAR